MPRAIRSVLLVAALSSGCVSLAQPGHYEPPAAPARPTPSRLTVALRPPITPPGGASLVDAFDASLRAHLQQAGLFARLGSAGAAAPADLWLVPSVDVCQPTTVFSDPLACTTHQSFGYSGMNVLLGLVTLGVWPAVTIFGVPSDWATASARVQLAVQDPVSAVELARFDSGLVEDWAVAGIYHRGSPLAEALASASAAVVGELDAALPALEARVARIEAAGTERDPERALASPEEAIRVRAVLALAATGDAAQAGRVAAGASDASPRVRVQVALALRALGADDPRARGALEVLARDADPTVQTTAVATRHALAFRAWAAATRDPQVAAAIRALESSATRPAALHALRDRGAAAAPATEALLAVLAADAPETRSLAVEALLAIGTLDARVTAALEVEAQRGNRDAELALAQRAAGAQPSAEPVAAPATPADAAPPRLGPIVAAFAIEAPALSAGERTTLTDVLAAWLTRTAGHRVVPGATLKARLAASKVESYRACVDEACQIEIGKALAAEKVVSTKIARDGRACLVTSTLYDLRTEAAERAAVVRGGCALGELTRMMEAVAEQLRG